MTDRPLHFLPAFLQITKTSDGTALAELNAGLCADQASISPKYFYDTLGSRLFEAICALPEYYPTRTEAAIFATHRDAIARATGIGATLIDLGAGNCAKAASLFSALQPACYLPVDISVAFLRDAVELLRQRFPQIAMTGIGLDFSDRLDLPEGVPIQNRLFFYPGSSIGNFTPDAALTFLRRIRAACPKNSSRPGGLLIGVDLVKDSATLEHAYDDALGVTAAFNRNILRHVNQLLGANFNVADWRHRALFNQAHSRIEMHLEAQHDVVVRWPGAAARRFAEGERIHTENSYKYTQQQFLALLEHAGFGSVQSWTDERGWFMVCHAQAV